MTVDCFRIDQRRSAEGNLLFRLKLLLLTKERYWRNYGFASVLNRRELLRSIEFLATTVATWESDETVSRAIGILAEADSDEGDSYIFGHLVERVTDATLYMDRNHVRYPKKKIHRIVCVLDALFYFHSTVFVSAVDVTYKAIIKPPIDDAWSLQRRAKLELTSILCELLVDHERSIGSWEEKSMDGLACLLDMAFHPCEFISTLGFTSLLSLSFYAPKRFKLIPKAIESLERSKDPWVEPGVGNHHITLLLNGTLHASSVERLIEECLSTIAD